MTQDVISKESLLYLLNAQLRIAGIDKADCEFTSVFWHEPNAGGCNWNAHLNPRYIPSEVVTHKAHAVSQHLSETYNIPKIFNIPG